jgi:hypothetical protein
MLNFLSKIKTLKSGTVLKMVLAGVLALGIISTAACVKTTSISDIKTDEAKYDGTTVAVKGTVTYSQWYPALTKGIFMVDDGSGTTGETSTIWIITSKNPPERNAQVTVSGTVQPAFSLLGTNYGTVLQESK